VSIRRLATGLVELPVQPADRPRRRVARRRRGRHAVRHARRHRLPGEGKSRDSPRPGLPDNQDQLL